MKKQRIFLVAALICCLALAGTGTLAFFRASETARNVITTGVLDMKLVEMHDGEPWPEKGVSGVMPGEVVSKEVTIQNLGGVDFYTRVKVTGQIKLEGKEAPIEMKEEHVELIELNDTDWTKGEDGYYYYNTALKAGENGTTTTTEPLFTAVKLKPALGNEYQNATLTVLVEAEAVQSKNNGDDPLKAEGWSTETNEDE